MASCHTCHPRPAEHRFCSLCRPARPSFSSISFFHHRGPCHGVRRAPRTAGPLCSCPHPSWSRDTWLKPAHGAAETLRPPGLWKHSHSFPLVQRRLLLRRFLLQSKRFFLTGGYTQLFCCREPAFTGSPQLIGCSKGTREIWAA